MKVSLSVSGIQRTRVKGRSLKFSFVSVEEPADIRAELLNLRNAGCWF